MPATDNSTVQVTINVVDANSGEVIGRITKGLNDFGNAGANSGKKASTGLKQIGEAGAQAGDKVAAGLDKIGGHAQTNLDSVRLLSQEFGLRLPRALESMASRIPLVTNAINGMMGAVAGIAIAEVLFRAGEAVYGLYEKWLDTTKAVNDYIHKAAEAAQQRLFDESSFDTTIGFLKQANNQIDQLQAKKKNRANSSLLDNIFLPNSTAPRFTTDDDKHLAQAMEISDRETLRTLQQEHELMLKNIDAHEKLSKAAANSSGAIAVERQAAKQRDSENLRYTQAVEQANADAYNRAHQLDPKKYPGTYTASKDAGRAEFNASENNSDIAGQASATELAFQQQKDLMQLRNQADQQGLTGQRLLQAQRVAAIEELVAKYKNQTDHNKQYAAEEAEINRKFDNEELARLKTQTDEVRKRVAAAAGRGLTGLAAIDARANSEKSDIDQDLRNGKYYGNRDQQKQYASGLKGAVDQGTAAEATQAQQQFYDRLSQMDASRSDRYQSENQRIQATADHTIAEITKAWTEMYGQLNTLDQRRVQSQQALNAEIVKIQQDAARQKQEAGQKLEDETEKMEEEGARAGHSRDQERTQQILDEYNDRYRQLEELRAQDSDNADKYRRQEIAAEQIKNGKLLDQQRELRDKLAGQLKGLFNNPLQELQRQGEEAASKIAANFILKMNPRTTLGGGFGDPGLGGRHGSILGHISGNGTANHSQTTLTASTATIYLQSATFAGVAAPGGNSGGFAGGSFSGAVSTSSLPALPGMSQSTAALGGELGAGVKSPATSMVGVGTSASGGSGSSTFSSVSNTLTSLPKMQESVAQLQKEVAPGMKMPNVTKLGGSKVSGILSSQKTAGIASGGLGLFGAFESNGGVGGALSGAFSGAKVGSEIGGPIGAAIGAIGGAVMGFLGFGGRSKAENYNNKQVKPRIADELQAYEAGSMDYQTVYNDFDSLSREAKIATRQWGSGGQSVYNNEIKGEISTAQTRLTREQKAGRSEFGMTAAQFHDGGFINDFGSMGTTNGQGWIHAEQGEFMLKQQAAMTHSTAAQLINSGASHSQMATYYGANKAPVLGSGGSDVNLHFHSHDAKGAYQLFMDNKHTIRAALNQSYAENSGGSDFA